MARRRPVPEPPRPVVPAWEQRADHLPVWCAWPGRPARLPFPPDSIYCDAHEPVAARNTTEHGNPAGGSRGTHIGPELPNAD